MHTPSALYIGIMSGTSLDGVDAVLVDFAAPTAATPPQVLAHCRHDLTPRMREAVRDFFLQATDQLSRFATLDVEWGQIFTQAVWQLMRDAPLPLAQVKAIGCHGQTLLHQPQHVPAFTVQLGNPHVMVAQLGRPVVTDWRRRDVALGGQGAPLAPCFHAAFFHHPAQPRIIVNLGGMANITGLQSARPVAQFGFDTGPGNRLLDAWIQRHQGQAYDAQGQWAASGKCHAALLALLETDPYWQRPAPKSTGCAYFNLPWLAQYLTLCPACPPVDVQCTLTHLTAKTIAQAIARYGQDSAAVWVCGGGSHNTYLMHLLNHYLPEQQQAHPTRALGYHPDRVEAMGFAWLAKQRMENRPVDLGGVTGVCGAYPLGTVCLP